MNKHLDIQFSVFELQTENTTQNFGYKTLDKLCMLIIPSSVQLKVDVNRATANDKKAREVVATAADSLLVARERGIVSERLRWICGFLTRKCLRRR